MIMNTNGNTKELIKDLCSRLPYGVKVAVNQSELQNYDYKWKNWSFDEEPQEIDGVSIYGVTFGCMDMSDGVIGFDYIKPYLFPLSSMTTIQENEFHFLFPSLVVNRDEYGFVDIISKSTKDKWEDTYNYRTCLNDWEKAIQWLLKNHFDINGLIPKNLANDATNLNIY